MSDDKGCDLLVRKESMQQRLRLTRTGECGVKAAVVVCTYMAAIDFGRFATSGDVPHEILRPENVLYDHSVWQSSEHENREPINTIETVAHSF
ncbi:hypothetical protein MRX96_016088 [Rhipicephalus microplus]